MPGRKRRGGRDENRVEKIASAGCEKRLSSLATSIRIVTRVEYNIAPRARVCFSVSATYFKTPTATARTRTSGGMRTWVCWGRR